ncbi:aldehyde dehydrogenase family protein [Zhouia sp. PK063]|uniref:aldehyde dehydrogenase family protein n=1 Tax=Zhouia sp. PK063 TaxID=3373602 RepID=UPI00378EDFE1
MKIIDKVYINGEFVTPQGKSVFDLVSPVNQEIIGRVTLGNKTDAVNAINAAKEAFKTFSKTSVEQRIQYLQQMLEAVKERAHDLIEAMVKEYGGPLQFSSASFQNALNGIQTNIDLLKTYNFSPIYGNTMVQMTPVGVVGIITPWNASNGFICSKLATAIAAGCTAVIKPSEMSAIQTQILTECLDHANLPKGVFNIVNGYGNEVGTELATNAAIAKISFTGSTVVGKTIAHEGAATVKRITLEMGGKSPNIIMPDAILSEAIPNAIAAAFMNSGQACIAATRLLIHENQLETIKNLIKENVQQLTVGLPWEADTNIGPMVSKKQYQKVQDYIQLGIDEGAEILIGGLGQPKGLEEGNFVKPTVFINVTNSMRIAQEEIFGPVLCIITYKTLNEAIQIANDTSYGLSAYIQGTDEEKAKQIACELEAGRIVINGFKHDPMAPFGGFKQSGIGREFGILGLQSYLEPKAILI